MSSAFPRLLSLLSASASDLAIAGADPFSPAPPPAMHNVRQHLGRTYVVAASGEGPFHGRFVVKGNGDGLHDHVAWHELDEDWPDAPAAVEHADLVARQYITTFAEQA